jgi:hypothetical protein
LHYADQINNKLTEHLLDRALNAAQGHIAATARLAANAVQHFEHTEVVQLADRRPDVQRRRGCAQASAAELEQVVKLVKSTPLPRAER